jgi:hypothetical protein
MSTRTADADTGLVRHDLGVSFTSPHSDNQATPSTDVIPTRRRKTA